MSRITHRRCFRVDRMTRDVGLLALICYGLVLQPPAVSAASPARVIRKVCRVGDDIPLRKLDDVAQELGKSRAGRDVLQKSAGHANDAAAYRRTLNRAVRELVEETGDPALFRHLNQLDDAAKESLLVLGRGSRTLREGIPDIAARARFLGDGGAETVAALGRYGDLMGDSLRFDAALRAGRIVSPPGTRRLALEDFGHFFRAHGDRGHNFWTKYVRPHWEKWLAGAALAAVLLAPDEYLDEAGEFTKAGARKIAKLGGDVLGGALAGTVEGVGEGTKGAVEDVTKMAFQVFLADLWGVAALLILVLIGIVGAFCARSRIRSWLARLGLIRNRVPTGQTETR
jgi:hypothetical protein